MWSMQISRSIDAANVRLGELTASRGSGWVFSLGGCSCESFGYQQNYIHLGVVGGAHIPGFCGGETFSWAVFGPAGRQTRGGKLRGRATASLRGSNKRIG